MTDTDIDLKHVTAGVDFTTPRATTLFKELADTFWMLPFGGALEYVCRIEDGASVFCEIGNAEEQVVVPDVADAITRGAARIITQSDGFPRAFRAVGARVLADVTNLNHRPNVCVWDCAGSYDVEDVSILIQVGLFSDVVYG